MLKRAFRLAGIDRPTFYVLLNKFAVIVSSIVTLALVVLKFSAETQGYYYTFRSLVVLQQLLEAGMGTVLVQFISHEWVKLDLVAPGRIEGEEPALARVAALVRVAMRWYAFTAIGFFAVVGLIGEILLTRRGAVPPGVMAPWWLLCAGVGVSVFQIPLQAFLEGSGQIARAQRIVTYAVLWSSVSAWLSIILGLELYALPIASGVTAIVGLVTLGRASLPFLRLARENRRESSFSWRHEFWPQQWRIAVSWMSGFFMFQSFVPILFYFRGPVLAGRIGTSLQMYNAVNQIASSWIYARGPKMGMLGASGQLSELKALARSTLVRVTAVAAGCATAVWAAIAVIKHLNFRADRFTGLDSLCALLVASVVIQRSNVETLVVRFQKIEPFMLPSIVSAALVFVSNMLMSRFYGILGVCIAYSAIVICVLTPWVHGIYGKALESSVWGRSRA
ncbi:MAG: hypothetical protein WAU49_03325 [Steroidobacteraceae bacterium]